MRGEGARAIHAEQLVRHFGDTPAVEGIDLAIEPGEIYGFLGPNGAGKTTTVRMLVTLLVPSSGRATVAGCDVVDDPGGVRLRIGVALQATAVDPQQTGEELLRLQGRLYGLPRSTIEQRLIELSAVIDIGDALGRRIKTYSGGMKRRVDLAAALVHNPQVLFLDEPTSGLDPASRRAMWHEVRRLNDELGMTIFLTTQYLEEADHLADRLGIIVNGRIVAEGTTAELKRRIGDESIVVQTRGRLDGAVKRLQGLAGVHRVDDRDGELAIATPDGSALVGPVALALESAGVAIERLTLRTPTLDDVFLKVTGSHMSVDEQETG